MTEGKKNVSQPLERKRTISFDKLIDQIAQGRRDEDAISTLAGRLAALDKKLEREDQERIIEMSGGKALRDLSNDLLDAIDPDKIEAMAEQRFGYAPAEDKIQIIQNELIETACKPFDDPKLRQLLKDLKQKSDIVIDDITTDEVIKAEYDKGQAEELKRSTTLRQSILKSAFSGKLVAQDPADEPASELLARIKSGDSPKTKTKAAAPRRGRKPRSDKSEAA